MSGIFAAEIHGNTRMKKTNLDGKDIQNQRKPEMHTLEDNAIIIMLGPQENVVKTNMEKQTKLDM